VDKKLTHEWFLQQIKEKGHRRLKAKKEVSIYTGLGMLGAIGWAVSIPTLIFAVIGWYLDKEGGYGHRWTLSLLVLGLVIGCWNASYWVRKQFKEIDGDEEEEHHDE
jgi:ATP synthase protein I